MKLSGKSSGRRGKTVDLTDSTLISRSNDAICSEIEDEWIIMSLDKGNFHSLDGPLYEIWSFISEPKTLSQLVEHLMSEFDVDAETCRSDVLDFLSDLSGNDLIVLESR